MRALQRCAAHRRRVAAAALFLLSRQDVGAVREHGQTTRECQPPGLDCWDRPAPLLSMRGGDAARRYTWREGLPAHRGRASYFHTRHTETQSAGAERECGGALITHACQCSLVALAHLGARVKPPS